MSVPRRQTAALLLTLLLPAYTTVAGYSARGNTTTDKNIPINWICQCIMEPPELEADDEPSASGGPPGVPVSVLCFRTVRDGSRANPFVGSTQRCIGKLSAQDVAHAYAPALSDSCNDAASQIAGELNAAGTSPSCDAINRRDKPSRSKRKAETAE